MDKLIPGSLNALVILARNGGVPTPAPAPSPDGGVGGGGGGGGGDKGSGKRKRGGKGNANPSPTPQAPTPGAQIPRTLVPGSLALCCSWKGQVLSNTREVKDPATQQVKTISPVHFDIGAFCKKIGADFNAFCWEFICSYFLTAYDRAIKKWRDMNGHSGTHAIRVPTARCPHSHSTSEHPESLAAKHALPPKLEMMATYFRQG